MSALGPMAGPPPQMLPLPPGGPGGPPGGPGGPGGDEPRPEAQAEEIARKAALAALHHWLQAESDPGDRAMIAKLISSAEKVDADAQQQLHDAMGMPPALKAALAQGPGSAAGGPR